jgi:glycosyltransferase involved in cell wall biosynthesis
VEHLRGAQYGLVSLGSDPDQKPHRNGRRPIVWDSVDCISHLFRQAAGQSKSTASRLITRFELPRTERLERSLLRKFDRILVTSAADREALLNLNPGEEAANPISIVTNGVDIDYFRPDPAVFRETRSLVLTGKMSYHANVSMAVYMVQEVMPVVWGKFPDIRIDIVGKDPSPEVIRLGSDPRVNVTGTVRDIRTYLNKASIAVSPIVYGAGIQNKILEAMATETPVVTTPAGASALQAKIGRDLLVGDSPESIGVIIQELLSDQTKAHEIGVNGRAYVEGNHHWPTIVERLVQFYIETIELRDPTRKPTEPITA